MEEDTVIVIEDEKAVVLTEDKSTAEFLLDNEFFVVNEMETEVSAEDEILELRGWLPANVVGIHDGDDFSVFK